MNMAEEACLKFRWRKSDETKRLSLTGNKKITIEWVENIKRHVSI